MNAHRTLMVVTSAALAFACGDSATGPDGRLDREFAWDGVMAPTDQFQLRGINGGVEAYRSATDAVRIRARIYGEADLASAVRVEVVEHLDGIVVCARYPDRDGNLSPCDWDDGISSIVETRDVRVEFTLEIPDGVPLDARVVNGAIDADIAGDVHATTVNGNLDLATDGVTEGFTVNGNIVAAIGAVDWGQSLGFATVNGSIRVRIRSGVDIRVSGGTVHGGIDTEFPLTVVQLGTGREIRGTMGAGTWRLTMNAVNGDLALLRYR